MTKDIPESQSMSVLEGQPQRADEQITSVLGAEIRRDLEDKKASLRRDEELSGRFDAKGVYDYLRLRIHDFESSLKENEEIGLQLANFGLAAQIHVRSMGFQDPNLVEFSGVDQNGHVATLIQHISQLNFMLVALKPVAVKPYRIGYI